MVVDRTTDLKNTFADIMNKSGQFSDEDDITGLNSLKKTHQFKKKTYELKLHLDSAQGYYLSRVGLNMHELTTSEYTVVFELYFPSASIAGLFIC